MAKMLNSFKQRNCFAKEKEEEQNARNIDNTGKQPYFVDNTKTVDSFIFF